MTAGGFPFELRPWRGEDRRSAAAIWRWHHALAEPLAPGLDGDDLQAYFDYEADRFVEGQGTAVVPEAVWRTAYQAAETSGLSVTLFADQIRVGRVFIDGVSFPDHPALSEFVDSWAVPHGRLLAALAGAERTRQLPMVRALSYAFFVTFRLRDLAVDAGRGRLFIPMDELEAHGRDADALAAGPVDEALRRVLWRQVVRARDAFAQAMPLASELSRRQALAFKVWWVRGLEMLNEMERRGFDVWSEPIRLSLYHRAQVVMQARFGRTTFR